MTNNNTSGQNGRRRVGRTIVLNGLSENRDGNNKNNKSSQKDDEDTRANINKKRKKEEEEVVVDLGLDRAGIGVLLGVLPLREGAVGILLQQRRRARRTNARSYQKVRRRAMFDEFEARPSFASRRGIRGSVQPSRRWRINVVLSHCAQFHSCGASHDCRFLPSARGCIDATASDA